VTTPGIPNDYTLSTTCFGSRLSNIQDQIFAAVGMGFRRLELGLTETPPSMEGLEDSQRETGVSIPSLVAGCRDPLNGSMAVERLGSLVTEECERAMNSVRRHVRLAHSWGCNVVVVRGNKVEDPDLRREAAELRSRWDGDGLTPELQEEVVRFVQNVQKSAQKHIEQFCRSLHRLAKESPETVFAIEPGREIDDMLGFDAMGWVMDDLESVGLTYWHDVGRIHLREKLGLPPQGEWLERFGARMAGIHLQDAAEEETEMPIGLGEVDFKLLGEYVPADAERVLEIDPRHGRAEILTSVRFLVDNGF
jgi:sugar phosphate isomerase/epimerase